MSRLIDKSVILLLCLLALGLSGNIAAPVAALLIATAGSSLVQLFSGTKKAAAVILICTAMCGFIPSVFCTVPLMLYDALYEKKWWAVLPASLVLTSSASLTPYQYMICLLYTSDAADDLLCVDLGGRRIIKKKKKHNTI